MFGLSWAGLAVALVILVPSFALLPWPARNTPSPMPKVGLPVTLLERVGQVGTLVLATVIVGDPGHPAWLGMVIVAVLAYYGLWARYFGRGREFSALYAPLGPLPVPMAVFPVLAFLAAAGWLDNPWLAGAAIILAAGHIPASLRIAAATR